MQRRGAPWWVLLCAAAFVGYYSLLVYCDLSRPEADGIAIDSGDTALSVRSVQAGLAGDRAGLRAGDRIVAIGGVRVDSRVDWMALNGNVRFGEPLELDVVRPLPVPDGGVRRIRIALTFGQEPASYWLSRKGIELLVTRLAQLVSLILGVIIVVRRPGDFSAYLGAWLLCSFGVYTVVMPSRFADVWRQWPPVVSAALWFPFLSARAIPALLLSFFLAFPTDILRPMKWRSAVWLPMAGILALDARYMATVVYQLDLGTLPHDRLGWQLGVSIGYLVATAVVVIEKYRRASVVERRRLGVLMLGGGVGCLVGGPAALLFWLRPQTSLFESPGVAGVVLVMLGVPLSFAYAILRHRLFDIRFIVRQGVRYALARRLLLSVVPILLVVLAFDVYQHRDREIGEWFGARASIYVLVCGLAVAAQLKRQNWLDSLDRVFFRERYDAQRVLVEVASEVATVASFEPAAARAVDRIVLALHSQFATVLASAPGDDTFRMVATSPDGAGPAYLLGSSKAVAVARVLGRPVDVSQGESAANASYLPPEDVEFLGASGIEIVVAIPAAAGGSDALLVLGGKRSEEPYAREDLEMLAAIGRALADLLSREHVRSGEARAFTECPTCGMCFDAGTRACADDGRVLSRVHLPRLLAGRYHLQRRLGRGGMGVVYAAMDRSLDRDVAVKLLREDLVGSRDTVDRFQREARISASFSHPHVVRIYDFGIAAESRAFLVMERLHGRTLRDAILDDGVFGRDRLLDVFEAVCDAVGAAHRRQLVHRDLKPENVFLAHDDGRETPKVLDFGIAKPVPEPGSPDGRETGVGLLVGTPRYMAPEQLRGEPPSPAWDLWALGVIAYEMLTATHPFADFAVGLTGMVAVPGGSGFHSVSTLPASCRSFFERALSVDAGQRPDSAAALWTEFAQAMRQD